MAAVPSAGPHGLDLDVARRRLFCACDDGRLVEIDADTGAVVRAAPLAGAPDVVFLNVRLARLYVAVGDPGVIEVFDTRTLRRVEFVRSGHRPAGAGGAPSARARARPGETAASRAPT